MRSGILQASPSKRWVFFGVIFSAAFFGCSPSDPHEEEPTTDFTYCDARIVIEEKCLRCHQEDGDLSAPFFLDTYDDISRRIDSLERVIRNGSMPFLDRDLEPEVEPLTTAERELLLEWLAAGAPEGEGSCE